jgi:hypothetical protein
VLLRENARVDCSDRRYSTVDVSMDRAGPARKHKDAAL